VALKEEHAVAVGEEAVSFANGVGVGGEDQFPAVFFSGKGADQHKQRGLWEVEVGQEAADDPELVAGAEKDTGLSGVRLKRCACCDLSAVFEGAGSGGAGGDDAATLALCCVDGFGSGGRERVVLGVEVDIFELFHADGLEGAKANVEGDGFDPDANLPELREDLGSEVQAGGGGGGRAGFVREDGLIAVAVLDAVVAMDVWRERHVADFVEDRVEVGRGHEAEGAFAELSGGENFGFEDDIFFVVEEETVAGLNLAAGADESGPVVRGKLLGQEDFDAAGWVGGAVLGLLAARAGGVETGRNDAAVVEDQQVARLQDFGEVAEKIVAVVCSGAVDEHHAAGATNERRGLSDQVFGEVEMEVGYTHFFLF